VINEIGVGETALAYPALRVLRTQVGTQDSLHGRARPAGA